MDSIFNILISDRIYRIVFFFLTSRACRAIANWISGGGMELRKLNPLSAEFVNLFIRATIL
jgi:hypothetical protein